MKKIIAFILLVCLFFNLSGYHLFFYLRKQELKADMKEFLRSSAITRDIEQFIFPLDKDLVAGVEWEGEKEFRLNGEMYDVVEKRIEDNKIIIRSISDEKETMLIKKYQDISKNDFGSSSKKGAVLLLKLINTLYITEFNSVYDDNLDYFRQPYRTDYINSLSSSLFEVLTPPPQS